MKNKIAEGVRAEGGEVLTAEVRSLNGHASAFIHSKPKPTEEMMLLLVQDANVQLLVGVQGPPAASVAEKGLAFLGSISFAAPPASPQATTEADRQMVNGQTRLSHGATWVAFPKAPLVDEKGHSPQVGDLSYVLQHGNVKLKAAWKALPPKLKPSDYVLVIEQQKTQLQKVMMSSGFEVTRVDDTRVGERPALELHGAKEGKPRFLLRIVLDDGEMLLVSAKANEGTVTAEDESVMQAFVGSVGASAPGRGQNGR